MKAIIGIAREEKNIWERRVPLIPAHVGELIRDQRLDIRVQTSPNRIFPEKTSGPKRPIVADLSTCSLIFAIKELPIPHLEKEKVYVFFTTPPRPVPQHAHAEEDGRSRLHHDRL